MNDKDAINIAIIGAGNDGAYLISALNECPSTRIVGFCDTNIESPNTAIAQELNIPLFERIEQLPSISEVDLIIDTSDTTPTISSLDALKEVEVLRGKGADVIKALAKKRKGHSEDVNNIFATGLELASKRTSKEMYRAIVEGAMRLTGTQAGSLIIFDERSELCKVAEVVGYSKALSEGLAWELQPGGITELLLDKDGPLFVPDITEEPLFDNPVMNEGTVSVVATALREADEVIGLLFAGDFRARQFSERELALFYAFAGQASLALQKALLLEKNEELSVTDALTGLNNGRHFLATLEAEVMRAKRYGGNFAVLQMDVDNLSDINDCFGHAKGDWALRKIAEIVRTCSRQTDYKARYGGDEFALILPNTSCEQATVLANRIRRQVHDVVLEKDGEQMSLSVSIGIAEFPLLGTTADSLIRAINTALTICKQRGRNLVCCYEESCEEGLGAL